MVAIKPEAMVVVEPGLGRSLARLFTNLFYSPCPPPGWLSLALETRQQFIAELGMPSLPEPLMQRQGACCVAGINNSVPVCRCHMRDEDQPYGLQPP